MGALEVEAKVGEADDKAGVVRRLKDAKLLAKCGRLG